MTVLLWHCLPSSINPYCKWIFTIKLYLSSMKHADAIALQFPLKYNWGHDPRCVWIKKFTSLLDQIITTQSVIHLQLDFSLLSYTTGILTNSTFNNIECINKVHFSKIQAFKLEMHCNFFNFEDLGVIFLQDDVMSTTGLRYMIVFSLWRH